LPDVTTFGHVACYTGTTEDTICEWLVSSDGSVSEPIETLNNCDNANVDDQLNVIDGGTNATVNNRTGASELVICEMTYD
jgi:hypothetical protein